MPVFLSRLIAFLSAAVAGILGWKVFLTGGFLVALFIGMYGLLLTALGEMLNFTVTAFESLPGEPGDPQSLAMSFSGLAGWLLTCWKVPECLTFMVQAVMFRWVVTKIPFIRW